MTNQERINQAAERIDEALHRACMPPRVIRETMAWVWEASFAILADAAHRRAMTVLYELHREGYTPELMNAYIRECVDLRQYDELKQKEKAGKDYLERALDVRKFEEMLQLLAEQFGDEEPEEEEASDEDLESLMEEYPVCVNINDGLRAYADPNGDDPEPEEDDDPETDAPRIETDEQEPDLRIDAADITIQEPNEPKIRPAAVIRDVNREADVPRIEVGTVDSVPEIGKARVADEP